MTVYLKSHKFELIFTILNIINLYILPVLAFYTMSGDKTDIIMSFGLCFVPLGWFIVSVFYGIAAGKIRFAPFGTAIMCLPLVFVPVITGETIMEKILAMLYVWTVSFIITFLGALLGRGIRRGVTVIFNGNSNQEKRAADVRIGGAQS